MPLYRVLVLKWLSIKSKWHLENQLRKVFHEPFKKGHFFRKPSVLGDRCIRFFKANIHLSPRENQTTQFPLFVICIVPQCNPKTTYICLSHVLQYSRHPINISYQSHWFSRDPSNALKKQKIKAKKRSPISVPLELENAMRRNMQWIWYSKDSHTWKSPGVPFSKGSLGGERLTVEKTT